MYVTLWKYSVRHSSIQVIQEQDEPKALSYRIRGITQKISSEKSLQSADSNHGKITVYLWLNIFIKTKHLL